MEEKRFFVFDFDSTFIQTEGLEEFFALTLKNDPKKGEKIKKIQEITNLGMEGKLDFRQSLMMRVGLLKANRGDLSRLNNALKKKISTSILRNKKFFRTHKDSIYIISGGFKEFVVPIVAQFGIDKDHVLANTFTYDREGRITGFDLDNPCSKTEGKVEAVKKLKLDGEVIVIGDGFTDLQVKEMGGAKKFVAFTENVYRETVAIKADSVIRSFDEFLYSHKLPMTLSYPKSKIKVLLLENIDALAVEKFKKEGYRVEEIKRGLSEEELREKIADVSILGIRSKTKITKKVLDKAARLFAVGTFTIGTDQMDLSSLSEEGVVVFNAPYQNTRSVVELALGEMILLLRGVFDKNNKMHQGVWDKSAVGSNEVRGKTLGIIGYGNIGSQLSVLAEALGMQVIFYDVIEKLPMGNAQRAIKLEELLKKSDVITIHVSGNRANTNIISGKEFSLMKDGVVFLNLSRGFVVDLKALVKFLKSGKIRGAAVDVFPNEPTGKDDPFESELRGFQNVILSPHIAGSTEEAQKNIGQFVSSKLIDFVNTGNTYLSVNLPNIQLPQQKNCHRLLHLHRNVPGILAQINNVLAENKINIEGQYLKTTEQVGYVITDVDKKYNSVVLNELKRIPETIKFRVLY
jgi:D-3-phosphoglycerate dehydrogenase / 2-oxoglutarate reductase